LDNVIHGARWTGEKVCKYCSAVLLERLDRRRGSCKTCKKISSKIGGAKRGLKQTQPTKFYCITCKKEITGKARQAKKNCSKKCESVYRTQNLSKENAKLWRGGSSYLDYPPEFNTKLRKMIRDRDNNTCQVCGREEQNLDVHHKNANKYDNSLENLVALCRGCHSKEDWKLRNARKAG
jgi:hypothetical protein